MILTIITTIMVKVVSKHWDLYFSILNVHRHIYILVLYHQSIQHHPQYQIFQEQIFQEQIFEMYVFWFYFVDVFELTIDQKRPTNYNFSFHCFYCFLCFLRFVVLLIMFRLMLLVLVDVDYRPFWTIRHVHEIELELRLLSPTHCLPWHLHSMQLMHYLQVLLYFCLTVNDKFL